MPNATSRHYYWYLLALAVGACVCVWGYVHGWADKIPLLLHAGGAFGWFASFGLILLQSMIPYAPFAVLAGLNASAHGYWLGLLATWLGAFVGSMLWFFLSRSVLRVAVRRHLRDYLRRHPRLARMQSYLTARGGSTGFVPILLLRVQPWLPSSIIDIGAGVSGVAVLPFVLATVLGEGPIIALESYMGHRLLHPASHPLEMWWMAGIGICVLVLYVVVSTLRKSRGSKH